MRELTAEDLARDLAADLALCERATAGPWAWPMPGSMNIENIGATLPGRRDVRIVAASRLSFKSSNQCQADAAMIAAARLGWPAAAP